MSEAHRSQRHRSLTVRVLNNHLLHFLMVEKLEVITLHPEVAYGFFFPKARLLLSELSRTRGKIHTDDLIEDLKYKGNSAETSLNFLINGMIQKGLLLRVGDKAPLSNLGKAIKRNQISVGRLRLS